MKEKVEKVLSLWHEHFKDEENQYSEFESSDVEYFVACMLYNHFAFSKALDTMKTIDLSYDFLSACGNEYDEIKAIIASIQFADEHKSLAFLQSFLQESIAKYTQAECYLLNRIQYHVNAMADRYEKGIEVQVIDFENPLLRK